MLFMHACMCVYICIIHASIPKKRKKKSHFYQQLKKVMPKKDNFKISSLRTDALGGLQTVAVFTVCPKASISVI